MGRGSRASEYLDRAHAGLERPHQHHQHQQQQQQHRSRTSPSHSNSHSHSRQDVSKDKDESYGYLFTGLVLLLPVLRSPPTPHQPRRDAEDENGLVMATRRKKDKKGKGRMDDGLREECSGGNKGLGGDDMVVLFRLVCLLAREYRTRNISRQDETVYDLYPAQLHATQASSHHKRSHDDDEQPIKPIDPTSSRGPGLTAFQAGAELAKALKVALEGLMEVDVGYPCRQETLEDRVELIQEQDRGYEDHEGGELIRASLALCLYILCKTQPPTNTSFYTLQLQELYPVHLHSADEILDSLFSESPTIRDSGPSTPGSPISTSKTQTRSSYRYRHAAGRDPGSPSSSSSRLQRQTDRPTVASQVNPTPTARRIFLPSRPSMISIFSTESHRTTGGQSFISYGGSIRSSNLDNGLLSKSTASLPQLSVDVSQRQSARENFKEPEPRAEFARPVFPGRRESRMRSMVDLPKAGGGGGMSIAEERLRRYQRNAAIEAQHAHGNGHGNGHENGNVNGVSNSHARSQTTTGVEDRKIPGGGRSGEKGWFSTFNYGTRRFSPRATGGERKVDREGVWAGSARCTEAEGQEERERLGPGKEETRTAKMGRETRGKQGEDRGSISETGIKQLLPHTPAATPAASRQLPLLVSPSDNGSIDPLSPKSTLPSKPPAPKRAPRAFEDASDPPLAPMDPRLLEAEMSSAMTQKVVCAVCHAKGVNFPSCRKCGDTFCSRECRVGMGAGGDGKKHVCGLLETRLLSRAAQSPNGNLLPSPPTVKPVKRVLIA